MHKLIPVMGTRGTHVWGKKKLVLSVVMSICVGGVLRGVIPTHLNYSKTTAEKSSKFISVNGCVDSCVSEMKE